MPFLTEACAEAYRVTRDETWFDRARTFLDWFSGNNDTGASFYDYQTDGLHADGPNLNQRRRIDAGVADCIVDDDGRASQPGARGG